LQPRDLPFRHARAGVNPPVILGISSRHSDGARVLMCDATIRTLKTDINATILKWILTINSGRPIAGWPADENEMPADFPPEVDAGQLKDTDVLPHCGGRIEPGRNYVYCASFQIAWDELKSKVVHGPVRLESGPPLAGELNRFAFPRTDLSADSYIAMAGLIRDGIVADIQTAMAEKFPAVTSRIDLPTGAMIVAYAYLQKTLPFRTAFDRFAEPLMFHGKTGVSPVGSFGIKAFVDRPGRNEAIKEQVTILDYANDNDFVIRLDTRSDEIILAKIAPRESLSETLDAVQHRIEQRKGDSRRSKLLEEESLVVPIIALNIARDYTEVCGRPLLNDGFTGQRVAVAKQVIRFLLDETGARLESEAEIVDEDDSEYPKPRQFIFDKPFLVFLREPPATEPYFAMWVENAELLERIARGDR
jgi:hypothetical protein